MSARPASQHARDVGAFARSGAWYLGVAVTVTLWCWIRARATNGPLLLPDESGPIEFARFMIGESGSATSQYYPGHGFTLIPAILIGDDADAEYRMSLLSGSVILGIHAALVAAIHRRVVPGGRRIGSAAIGIVVGVLPATVAASVLIWSEASVLLATSAIALGVVVADRRRSTRMAFAIAALAGLSIVIHPRLISVAFGAWCALAASNWHPDSARRRTIALLTLSTALGLATGRWIVWMLQRAAGSISYAITPGDAPMSDRAFSFVMITIGQIVIATIGTAGLLWFAMPRLPDLRRHTGLDAMRVFALSAFVAFVVLTAVRFEPPIDRADIFYYSRYASPVYPLLIVGALAGRRWYAGRAEAIRTRTTVALVVVGVLVAYQIWRISPAERSFKFLGSMAPELFWIVDRAGELAVVWIAGIAIVAVVSGRALLDRRASVTWIATVVVILAVVVAGQTRPGHAGIWDASTPREWRLVDDLLALPDDECIAFDARESSQWNKLNYEFHVPNPMRYVTPPRGEPCGPHLISVQDDIRDLYPEAELVGSEPRTKLRLYRIDPTNGPAAARTSAPPRSTPPPGGATLER